MCYSVLKVMRRNNELVLQAKVRAAPVSTVLHSPPPQPWN